MYRYLLGLCLEHVAGNTDNVADIVLAEVRKLLRADSIGADVELYLSPVVLDMSEDGLAHAALGHDAPGDGNGLVGKCVIIGLDLL